MNTITKCPLKILSTQIILDPHNHKFQNDGPMKIQKNLTFKLLSFLLNKIDNFKSFHHLNYAYNSNYRHKVLLSPY